MAWPGSNIIVTGYGDEAPYGYSYGDGGLGYKSRRSRGSSGRRRTYVPGANRALSATRTRKSMRRRRGF